MKQERLEAERKQAEVTGKPIITMDNVQEVLAQMRAEKKKKKRAAQQSGKIQKISRWGEGRGEEW